MGESVGRTLVAGGAHVRWVSAGRSDETASRAGAAGLVTCVSLEQALDGADAVVSVCPPDQAEVVAESVAALGFAGLYVDANAIAPSSSLRLAERFGERYVDGGIIGPPALKSGTTRLYLSGARAREVASWFDAGPLAALAIGFEPSAASALKMAYAAYSKGSAALLLASAGMAEQAGVADWLRQEWDLSQPGLKERAEATAQHVGPKAWRFAGEMEEIARSLTEAGLPGGFHEAAADAYRRLASLKGTSKPSLQQALELLLNPPA